MTNGKMKIVVTESENFSAKALQNLSLLGEVVLLDVQDRLTLLRETKDATILFVRLRFHIDEEIVRNATELKYIITATTGLDHIDEHYFESRGGQIISLKGEYDFLGSVPSTAEHTWGLLLALIRNTAKAFEDVKNGFWRRDLFKGNNLKGKKIGILGLGRVGKQVAKYADAFDMQVGYYDIDEKGNTPYLKFENLIDMFSWSDILSIHIPLTAANQNFVSKVLLDELGPDSYVINTSRGSIVDEKHLCSLIESNKIKGYATDVLKNEISIGDAVATQELVVLAKKGFNVLVTPHIAGATFESMALTEEFVSEKILKFVDSRRV